MLYHRRADAVLPTPSPALTTEPVEEVRMANHAPITAEYVRSRIDYDPETGRLTWKPKPVQTHFEKIWNTRFAGKPITSRKDTGHIQFSLDGRFYLAHRIAWLIAYGEFPNSEIDHENGVPDDNRLSNLRTATRSQNGSNRRLHSNNTSGFRGVSLLCGKWSAYIRIDNRTRWLGSFPSREEAAQAYDNAARQLHGEFARTNFKRTGD